MRTICPHPGRLSLIRCGSSRRRHRTRWCTGWRRCWPCATRTTAGRERWPSCGRSLRRRCATGWSDAFRYRESRLAFRTRERVCSTRSCRCSTFVWRGAAFGRVDCPSPCRPGWCRGRRVEPARGATSPRMSSLTARMRTMKNPRSATHPSANPLDASPA
uniref:(northern house mosquito) hypothetical protein n=1 Tax=Culex pipiens TaxID=7175 RepID=A0A8D8F6Z0_CULPI